jgi:hypothetical protein
MILVSKRRDVAGYLQIAGGTTDWFTDAEAEQRSVVRYMVGCDSLNRRSLGGT